MIFAAAAKGAECGRKKNWRGSGRLGNSRMMQYGIMTLQLPMLLIGPSIRMQYIQCAEDQKLICETVTTGIIRIQKNRYIESIKSFHRSHERIGGSRKNETRTSGKCADSAVPVDLKSLSIAPWFNNAGSSTNPIIPPCCTWE